MQTSWNPERKVMEEQGFSFSAAGVFDSGCSALFEDQPPPPQHAREPELSDEMIRCRHEGHVGEPLLNKSEFYVNRRVCKKCFRQSTRRQRSKPSQEQCDTVIESLKEEMTALHKQVQSLEGAVRSLQEAPHEDGGRRVLRR